MIPRQFTAEEIRAARAGNPTDAMRALMLQHLAYQSDCGWDGEEGRLAAAMMLCGLQADDNLLEAVSGQIVAAREHVEGTE